MDGSMKTRVAVLMLLIMALGGCGSHLRMRVEPCRVPLAVHKGKCGHYSIGKEWRW